MELKLKNKLLKNNSQKNEFDDNNVSSENNEKMSCHKRRMRDNDADAGEEGDSKTIAIMKRAKLDKNSVNSGGDFLSMYLAEKGKKKKNKNNG